MKIEICMGKVYSPPNSPPVQGNPPNGGDFRTESPQNARKYRGVSKNSGTPQIINFDRVFPYTIIFGNTHRKICPKDGPTNPKDSGGNPFVPSSPPTRPDFVVHELSIRRFSGHK